MILVIDNYDSFTYNLVQYLGEMGEAPVVVRNDAITLDRVDALDPLAVVVSPGPCTPNEAGVSNALIDRFAGALPIFGVCLGLQCMGQVFGGRVVRAPEPVHGKTSMIRHDGRTIFAGVPSPLVGTRYHSLVVARDSVPADVEVSAESEDGLVMGLRHRAHLVEGVQFHPESILTEHGRTILRNFVALARAQRARKARGTA